MRVGYARELCSGGFGLIRCHSFDDRETHAHGVYVGCSILPPSRVVSSFVPVRRRTRSVCRAVVERIRVRYSSPRVVFGAHETSAERSSASRRVEFVCVSLRVRRSVVLSLMCTYRVSCEKIRVC